MEFICISDISIFFPCPLISGWVNFIKIWNLFRPQEITASAIFKLHPERFSMMSMLIKAFQSTDRRHLRLIFQQKNCILLHVFLFRGFSFTNQKKKFIKLGCANETPVSPDELLEKSWTSFYYTFTSTPDYNNPWTLNSIPWNVLSCPTHRQQTLFQSNRKLKSISKSNLWKVYWAQWNFV